MTLPPFYRGTPSQFHHHLALNSLSLDSPSRVVGWNLTGEVGGGDLTNHLIYSCRSRSPRFHSCVKLKWLDSSVSFHSPSFVVTGGIFSPLPWDLCPLSSATAVPRASWRKGLVLNPQDCRTQGFPDHF